MENKKAFILYYLLPFAIYILFSALQSYNPRTFWGLIAMGVLFALMGLFLMMRSMKSPAKSLEELTPAFQEAVSEELIAPLQVGPDPREEKIASLEGALKNKDEELGKLRSKADEMHNHLTQQTELIKQKDMIIQELRVEVKSLMTIAKG